MLIVEFEPSASEPLVRYLEPHGYQAVIAGSAEGVLRQVLELRPDAITLDLLMPGKSGWKLLHELRHNSETATIPVLVIAVLDEQKSVTAMGASEYLAKPLKNDIFLAALARHVCAAGAA